MDVKTEVLRAEQRIRPYIRETYLDYSESLSSESHGQVFLKLENLQVTGSFKARGSLNKVLSLSEAQKAQGIVTASTGNHGLGVANALTQTQTKGTIYLPHNVSPVKAKAIKAFKVPIEFYGADSLEAETRARKIAVESGQIYISPYNDPQVIGGQGTIGVELLRQLPALDCVLVAVGGGGLIGGIAGYLKEINPKIKVIGCLPENAPVMSECLKAGKIINVAESPTLSDGTAGGLDQDSITFEICQKYIDDFILVNEDEIADGMCFVIENHRQIIEGSAGVTVAAFLKEKERFANQNIALIMCGGNISFDKLKRVIGGGAG
jgi:threonine dehydratase